MKNIILIKLGAIGDLLMATPAFRALREAYPDATIALLTGRSCLSVVRDMPFFDKILTVDDRIIYHGGMREKALESLRAIYHARSLKADCLISLHRDRRFALLARLIGSKRRIGLSYLEHDPLLTDTIRIMGVKHHVDHYLSTLVPLGVVSASRKMAFPVKPSTLDWGWRKLEEVFPGRPVVGIAPGGAKNIKEEMSSRRWPLRSYQRLAELLGKWGCGVAVFGGPDDVYVEDAMGGCDFIHSFVGKTSLQETAALMAGCRVVVAHDSGPMHLASAMNTPVVSLFGPTNPLEKEPLNPGSRSLWKPESCEMAPCYRDGIFPKCASVGCMEAFSIEEVFGAVVDFLQNGEGSGQ